jgi:hypothetical protein
MHTWAISTRSQAAAGALKQQTGSRKQSAAQMLVDLFKAMTSAVILKSSMEDRCERAILLCSSTKLQT